MKNHSEIQRWMRQKLEEGPDFFEPLTGEIQITQLAEAAAFEFDVDPDRDPDNYELLFEDSFAAESDFIARLEDQEQLYFADGSPDYDPVDWDAYHRENSPVFADPFARPDWTGDPSEY